MTRASDLADCILSGQVPDQDVPSLVAETPGLREELERRSAAMSPAASGEAGRGDRSPSRGAIRPADPFHFRRKPALALGIHKQESRRLLKTRGLLLKFFRSFHLPSRLQQLWRR